MSKTSTFCIEAASKAHKFGFLTVLHTLYDTQHLQRIFGRSTIHKTKVTAVLLQKLKLNQGKKHANGSWLQIARCWLLCVNDSPKVLLPTEVGLQSLC
mmetsp:Transcript_1344/g.2945  ORF Transcript_1344/g.2945 Transcript_1344/m.2945 type:complete len:98 (+) Transcript_1344:248-541(+)